LARAQGLDLDQIRASVRTGDTPQSERTRMSKQAPHILVTTPESLYILLTSERARKMLSTVRTLIVDEITRWRMTSAARISRSRSRG
jgi:ATP-dependent Lhr-like helicase